MEAHELRNKYGPRELRARLEAEGFPRTTLSFYRYVRLADPAALRNELYAEWEAMGVFGRIYLANEGINAQLSVPTHNFEAFRKAIDARPEFSGVPFKIAVEDDGKSFLKLTLKVRQKLVADGLTDAVFDVSNVGQHLDAEAFNRKLEEGALVVDMRNNYECLVGHFEGAYLPKAETFRGAIDEVVDMLRKQPAQVPDQGTGSVDPPGRPTTTEQPEILLYCTGGIRCEKASAWLRHHGITNVGQLHGGIIDYARQVRAKGLPSRYKGQNFVFDGRLAERITDDVVSTCMQCGQPSDRITNCQQHTCNMLLVQCEACATTYADCCTPSCREIHLLPEEVQREWRKGKPSASAKMKAIRDPEALRKRIAEEEEELAEKGTLHPELIAVMPVPQHPQ
ncbi:MAG: rhodanese domain-containing protein [Flavobacteriales bacterium]|nr:rhodanese domain-containing protein [Flavobacteriales bacterium]